MGEIDRERKISAFLHIGRDKDRGRDERRGREKFRHREEDRGREKDRITEEDKGKEKVRGREKERARQKDAYIFKDRGDVKIGAIICNVNILFNDRGFVRTELKVANEVRSYFSGKRQ